MPIARCLAIAPWQLLTWKDDEGKATMWHSSAHLLAEAVEALYPGTKFGIGPPIENGFYYDIDLATAGDRRGDFAAIEAKMKELAGKKEIFARTEVSKADAIKYFTEKGDEYKLELIDGLERRQITFYSQGNFTDLCRGPHFPTPQASRPPRS
jgi:threonyl-tRNA synthetase